MESIISYKSSNPLLIDKISSIVFWRRSVNYTESMIFLPNNICGFGFTLSGNNNNYLLLHKQKKKYKRQILMNMKTSIITLIEFFSMTTR